MNYLEKPPSLFLQRYLEAFWQLEATQPHTNPAREKILPDGCTEIVFNLADRFQNVLKALEANAQGWSNVALACGYYDQAHLIHDFKAFSGQNSSAFLLAQTQMSAYLTRKNRTSFFCKKKS